MLNLERVLNGTAKRQIISDILGSSMEPPAGGWEMFFILLVAWGVVISWVAITIYRLAKNDWVIDLKRWNLLRQFREGKRDEGEVDDK